MMLRVLSMLERRKQRLWQPNKGVKHGNSSNGNIEGRTIRHTLSYKALSLMTSSRILEHASDIARSSVSSSTSLRDAPSVLNAGRALRGILRTAKKSDNVARQPWIVEMLQYGSQTNLRSLFHDQSKRPTLVRYDRLELYVRSDVKMFWGPRARRTV